ncbi:MAG: T9SS type A sorting domain-containing protein [bacterium]
MRKKYHFVILIIYLLVETNFLNAQWVQTNGPYGGPVNCIVVLKEDVFIGTNNGVYLSNNNCVDWVPVNDGFDTNSSFSIKAITAAGVNLFASTDDAVYHSNNNGISWEKVNQGLENKTVVTFAVYNEIIFAGTFDSGVYCTTNNGKNWTEINDGLWVQDVRSLVFLGTKLFAGTTGGLWVSSNYGTSWSIVASSWLLEPSAFFVNGTDLFFGTEHDGVFRSTDNGESFTQINNGFTSYLYKITSFAASGNNIFASFDLGGLYYSSNNGESWQKHLSYGGFGVNALVVLGENIIVGSNYYGIIISTDNGMVWSQSANGLINTSITSIQTSNSNLFAHINYYDVAISNDNGDSWRKINKNLLPLIHSFAVSDTNLFVSTQEGIQYSSNYGDTWILVNNGLPAYPGIVFSYSLYAYENNVFAANMDLYHSTNNGNNWVTSHNGLPNPRINDLDVMGSTLFICSDDGSYKSTNNGASWVSLYSLNFSPQSMVISGKDIYACEDVNIYLSTNSGISWKMIPFNNTISQIFAYISLDSNLFVSNSEGIFVTSNNGVTWQNVGDGLPNTVIRSFQIKDDILYAGTDGRGIWKRPLSEMFVSVEKITGEVPNSFVLKQNYPNPFNPSTTISFSLPKQEFVTIKIYDILGKEIATLVNEELGAGNYNKAWNAENYSSGIYFCRFNAGSFLETRKMNLLK